LMRVEILLSRNHSRRRIIRVKMPSRNVGI
jgi:hypothetical protein